MAARKSNILPLLSIILILYAVANVCQPAMAARPLNGATVLESLPKGPVTPSGPSGCTYAPGNGGRPCTLATKNFVVPSAPAAASIKSIDTALDNLSFRQD